METKESLESALLRLSSLCREVSEGKYERADELFGLTVPGAFPSPLPQLAEAFGLMMVSVEAREFSLRQALASLEKTAADLEEARKKLAAENLDLKDKLVRLTVEIDQCRKEQEVCEITESDYFQNLQKRAAKLREGM
ncbi:MAG: hypothetical protein AB1921_04700 [Thermodesulfobacteriota bacterium]